MIRGPGHQIILDQAPRLAEAISAARNCHAGKTAQENPRDSAQVLNRNPKWALASAPKAADMEAGSSMLRPLVPPLSVLLPRHARRAL